MDVSACEDLCEGRPQWHNRECMPWVEKPCHYQGIIVMKKWRIGAILKALRSQRSDFTMKSLIFNIGSMYTTKKKRFFVVIVFFLN